jgi:hypothetical protein
VSNNTDAEIEAADEAFLSFGGWAKAMPNPPGLHETRRYTVDVECTAAGIGTSEKGERHTRKLSILRVSEVTGVTVPRATDDENQGALFDDPVDDEDGTAGEDGEAATVTPLFQGAGDE